MTFQKRVFNSVAAIAILVIATLFSLGQTNPASSPIPVDTSPEKSLALRLVSAQTDVITLEVGKPIERELKAGEANRYQIDLLAGQFMRVVTEQLVGDVMVRVIDPEEKILVEVDTPYSRSPEWLSFIAETGGVYHIEVLSTAKDVPGKYRIKLADLRMAGDDEHYFAAAQTSLREANLIMQDKKPEAFARSKVKIDEAAASCELITSDQRLKADGFLEIAKVFRSQGAKEVSLASYDRAAAIFEKAGLKYETLTTVGQSALMDTSNNGYLHRYEKAYAIAKEIGNRRAEVGSLAQIANSYNWNGDLSKSIEIYRQALSAAEEIGYNGIIGQIYGGMGQAYFALSDFSSAMESDLKAIEAYRTRGDPNEVGWINQEIGKIYFGLGNDRIALEKFQETLKEAERVNEPILLAFALSSIGDVYSRKGEYDKALEYYLKAEPILTIYNPNASFIAYSKIATVYSLNGRYKDAIEYMQKLLEGCKEHEQGVCVDFYTIIGHLPGTGRLSEIA